MTLVALRAAVTEPLRVQIAAGWFSMGSDVGQSVEGPVHRVWVDSFAMATTQVTIEEYARFLDVTGRMPPPYWGDPNFSRSAQPVVAVSWFDAIGILRVAFRDDRLALSAPHRSRMGARRAGRCGGNVVPLGE